MEPSGDGFLILGPNDLTYLQCSGCRKRGFALEYQDGSVEHHYRAKRTDFDADTIAAKFTDYATGGGAWKKGVEWEELSW